MRDRVLNGVKVTIGMFLALSILLGLVVAFLDPRVFQVASIFSIIVGLIAIWKPNLVENEKQNALNLLSKLPFEVVIRDKQKTENWPTRQEYRQALEEGLKEREGKDPA